MLFRSAGQRLSLTVLPDWLAAPELETLLAAADESVLQLHGIGHRRRSLFDATEAQAWTRRFARRSAKPFRVALPTYGSRAGVNPSGRIAWVESEVTVADGAGGGREWFANPADVADFLRWLGKQTSSRLAGVAWFRLPLAGDRRAWTPATWRAVINGRDEPVRLDGELRPGGVAHRYTVVVHNRGAIDVPWPMAATIEPPCRGILAAKGYRLEEDASESVFLRSEQGLLRAGSEVSVGLAECVSGRGLVGEIGRASCRERV